MILIDRKDDINWLETAYSSKRAEFIIVYGRRRIGKTYLLKYFVQDKPHLYYLAKQKQLSDEFVRLKEMMGKKFNFHLEANNFEGFFKEIMVKLKSKQKFILVIDEFPYWVLKNKEVLSEFQYLWDEVIKDMNILLILSGSYISVMEDKILSYKSPLYGRKTSQINLKEMPITSVGEFFKNIKNPLEVYGLTDTIPYYMVMWETSLSFEENLKNFISPRHNFYQDAEIIVREELREYVTYLEILRAINEGCTKLSEISNQSRVDVTNLPKYIKVLSGLGLINRVKPITSSPKEKNFLYEISDNYFRFWLTYIYPYKEEIEENLSGHLKFILQRYPLYMGKIFEKICRKALPFLINDYSKIGAWWYKDKEIDIVALNEKTGEILFCECKWQEEVDAKIVFTKLKEKAPLVQWNNTARKEKYVIFAKSFKVKIKEPNLFLFDIKDLEKGLLAKQFL